MCGIVGYIGKKDVLPILMKGLRRLEYRGYDSAGIAYFLDQNIKIQKSIGRIQELEKKVSFQDQACVGIGHTRWATHGGVDLANSHPHQVQNITIVHNGILENYQELKQELLEKGYLFQSDTDTEVACGYIDYLYQQSKTKNFIEILTQCQRVFHGSYAIVGMVEGHPEELFVMKKDSPLIIGIGEDGNYIASDLSAYGDEISGYYVLEDMEIGLVDEKQIQIFRNGKKIPITIHKAQHDFIGSDKDHFEHYMLKEIWEQKDLVTKWNKYWFERLEKIPAIDQYQKIQIIGCGTAYHAGLIGKYLIEEYDDFAVEVFIASEYRYQKIFVDPNTLVIFVSQSGETADTLACVKRVQEYGAHTLGIVNVKNSSIARMVEQVIYTEAGPEIAVASTKAYLAQIYVFSLIAFKLGISRKSLTDDLIQSVYSTLPTLLEELMHYPYEEMIQKIYQKEDIFYLGRNRDFASVLEGSLKLKEVSYIHSEAMPAGELKHGTISLIEQGSPVIALVTQKELASKMISNLKEVKARGAYVVLVITDDLISNLDRECYDEMITMKRVSDLIQPMVTIIPLQLIAYYVAQKRGCDIDKPRNLAKSVTVE